MSQSKDMKNQITEGVIWKQLLLFCFPIILGTLFQQMYNAADVIVVGQFVGKEELDRAIHASVALSVMGGIILTVAGLAGITKILRLMDTPAEIMDGSLAYLRIYFGGILFVFVYNIGSAVLRAMGDVIVPMVMNIAGLCGIRILWIVFAVPHFPDLYHIILSCPVSWVVTAAAFILYYGFCHRKMECRRE